MNESDNAVPPEIYPETLETIKGLGEYLGVFGPTLGRKANDSLKPLHVPDRDKLPDFSRFGMELYPAQAHVAFANAKLLNERYACVISGQCGVGKTPVSIAAVDEAARKSRRKGGYGGNYTCGVVCPDHLIKKWVRHIEKMIPGAVVRRFGRDDENGDDDTPKKAWADFIRFMEEYNVVRRMAGGNVHEVKHGARWAKPKGANWFVFGRNQIKWYSDTRALGEPARCFDGATRQKRPRRGMITGSVVLKDEQGNDIYEDGSSYIKKTKPVAEKLPCCPKCGARLTDEKGDPLSWAVMQKKKARYYTCAAKYLEEVVAADRQGDCGKDRIHLIPSALSTKDSRPTVHQFAREAVGKEVKVGGRSYVIRRCNEPLWQYTAKPWRWSIAKLVQKKMKGFFNYIIADECHEFKDPNSIQAIGFGKMIAASDHAMTLTGTLINGYADSLFSLLMRLDGRNLQQRGFDWSDRGETGAFVEEYGRIDTIFSSKAPLETITTKGSGRKHDFGKVTKSRRRAPGIMPTLFGHVLAPVTTFLTLEELADELPDLTEVLDEGCVDLPPDILAEYQHIENVCVREARRQLARGSMRFLGAMLQTLLAYPDMPYGWIPMFEGEHAVGYWTNPVADHPELMRRENWHGVCSPWNFDMTRRIMPKEKKLIEVVKRGLSRGEQTWIYVQMTKTRNIMPRLQGLLKDAGIRAGILNDYDVDTTEREDWIRKNGDKYDTVMCFPKLVSTGLDLFWRDDLDSPYLYNFNNLFHYQTGYNLFDIRQASSRSWRLGQDRDCHVYYAYYRDTMQHKAMELVSRKLEAALQVEGDFSEDGLSAMASDGSIQMELCKKLSTKIDDRDIGRRWTKVKAGGRKYKAPEKEEDDWDEDKQPAGEWAEVKDEPFVVPAGHFIMQQTRLGYYLCHLVQGEPEAYIEAKDLSAATRPSIMLTRHDVSRDRWTIDVDSLEVEALIELTGALRRAGFHFGSGGGPAESRDVGPKQHVAGTIPAANEPDEWAAFDDLDEGQALVAETIVAHGHTVKDEWADFDDLPEEDEPIYDPVPSLGMPDDIWEMAAKEEAVDQEPAPPPQRSMAARINEAMRKAMEENEDWDF